MKDFGALSMNHIGMQRQNEPTHIAHVSDESVAVNYI